MSDRPTDPDETRRRLREARRELRRIEQPARDRKLRKGRAKPRNAREWEIFAADIIPKRDAQEDVE